MPFSKLKSVDVESNIFMYYLKQLINEDLVEKRDSKYGLTTKGLIMAGSLSWKTFSTRIQPRIVTMIVCKNKARKYLLYRSYRQPSLNLVGFPYGKLHLGEMVSVAAKRELKDKSGLEADLFHKGDVYVTVFDGADVVNQMLIHVFSGEQLDGTLIGKQESGECFWGSVDVVPKEEQMYGFEDIFKILSKNPKRFFFQEFVYRF